MSASPATYFSQLDVEAARAEIRSRWPSFEASEFQLRKSFVNFILQATGDKSWVFKFAGSEIQARHCRHEKFILDHLRAFISVRVPNMIYFSERPAILGYERIPGQTLDVTDSSKRELLLTPELAEQIAGFLAQLHTIDTSGLSGEPIERDGDTANAQGIREYLELIRADRRCRPTLPFIEDALEAYERLVPREKPLTLVHDDLQAGNIILDPNPGGLAGIIDFTNASLSDPHRDFRFLYKLGFSFRDRVIAAYEQTMGKRIDRARLEVLERLGLSLHIVTALRRENPAYLERKIQGIAKYQAGGH